VDMRGETGTGDSGRLQPAADRQEKITHPRADPQPVETGGLIAANPS